MRVAGAAPSDQYEASQYDVNGVYALEHRVHKAGRPVWTHTERPKFKVQFSTKADCWMLDNAPDSALFLGAQPVVPQGLPVSMWAAQPSTQLAYSEIGALPQSATATSCS